MVNNEQNTQINVDQKTLAQAARIAIQQDKPIMLDYYMPSVNKVGARIVKTNEGENILYKSTSEYTSPIKRLFKMGTDIIALSNNSIYIVHHTVLN
tara:strand:+ start:847 stop:1134 length:288 start_codon:yes stop_codon:yes gene_type:complete